MGLAMNEYTFARITTRRTPASVQGMSSVALESFAFHTQSSLQRQSIENFIAEKYLKHHQANISHFLPLLLSMHDTHTLEANELLGAIGLKLGMCGSFFLEQYLDKPVEQTLSTLIKQPVDRHSLIEIGNLAVGRRGKGLLLFMVFATLLQTAGYRWMVFTATADVAKLIERLGCKLLTISDANPQRLDEQADDWGSYYRLRPQVMACDLTQAVNGGYSTPILARVLENHADTIKSLSKNLTDFHRLSQATNINSQN